MARDCEGFSRRDVLKVGSAGLLGLTLPRLLKLESKAHAAPAQQGQSRRATSVIMVWLSGGPAYRSRYPGRPVCPSFCPWKPPRTDAVNDAFQAIRLARAHAAEWKLDPAKIGIMGFSAGAELSAPAALFFEDFARHNSDPTDPLAKFG